MSLEKRIYLVCPVREISAGEKEFLAKYVADLKARGYQVHYPLLDTDQTQSVMGKMDQNKKAMKDATEVHVYWNPISLGSIIDLGMLYMAEKPVRLINRGEVENIVKKNLGGSRLEQFLLYLDKINPA